MKLLILIMRWNVVQAEDEGNETDDAEQEDDEEADESDVKVRVWKYIQSSCYLYIQITISNIPIFFLLSAGWTIEWLPFDPI